MAKCASKIIQQNGFGDKIQIIPKRSTEITVGSGNLRLHYKNHIHIPVIINLLYKLDCAHKLVFPCSSLL